MSESHAGYSAATQRDRPAGDRHRTSAEIEQDIEATLQQIDASLSAIEERFAIRRAFGPLREFFSTPGGKALLLGALVTFARRKPLLACTLGAGYLYYRMQSRPPEAPKTFSVERGKEKTMARRPDEPTGGDNPLERKTEPLKGPQVKAPISAIEAGSETSADGEYLCEGCGHRVYLEKRIIVPACPDCGGRTFRKEGE